MRVRIDRVGEPAPDQVERAPAGGLAEPSLERAGRHRRPHARRDQRLQPLGPVAEDRGALGVGEQDPVAAVERLMDDALQLGARRLEGALEQQPAPVAQAHGVQRLVVELGGLLERDLRAGEQLQPQALVGEAGAQAARGRRHGRRGRLIALVVVGGGHQHRRTAGRPPRGRGRASPRWPPGRRRCPAGRGCGGRSAQYAPRPDSTVGTVASRISMSRARDQPATYW